MAGEAELIGALEDLAVLLEAGKRSGSKGRGKSYYYDTINVKRWVLGGGGKAGNCEICEDNADMDWIPDDAVFEGVFGAIDGPEGHPHCECTLEYKEKRVRVYV